MHATSFPPPLWGRDRERGGDNAPSVRQNLCRSSMLGSVRSCSRPTSELKHAYCLLYPSPCPSPTRGEGTMWHCSAQPHAAFAYELSGTLFTACSSRSFR